MIKPFTDDGNLSPGIHIYSHSEFIDQFVKEFETSESRQIIHSLFLEWLNMLIQVVPPRYM